MWCSLQNTRYGSGVSIPSRKDHRWRTASYHPVSWSTSGEGLYTTSSVQRSLPTDDVSISGVRADVREILLQIALFCHTTVTRLASTQVGDGWFIMMQLWHANIINHQCHNKWEQIAIQRYSNTSLLHEVSITVPNRCYAYKPCKPSYWHNKS